MIVRLSDDVVKVHSQDVRHMNDVRSADLHSLGNVPVRTNGDVDHARDASIYRFELSIDPNALARDVVLASVAHFLEQRPAIARRLISHRWDRDDLEHIDLHGPNALHQLRAAYLAHRLLQNATAIAGYDWPIGPPTRDELLVETRLENRLSLDE